MNIFFIIDIFIYLTYIIEVYYNIFLQFKKNKLMYNNRDLSLNKLIKIVVKHILNYIKKMIL